jgi:hypothetical protein
MVAYFAFWSSAQTDKRCVLTTSTALPEAFGVTKKVLLLFIKEKLHHTDFSRTNSNNGGDESGVAIQVFLQPRDGTETFICEYTASVGESGDAPASTTNSRA